jgi:protein subunit release factor B
LPLWVYTMSEKINILSAKDLEISYFIGSGAGGQNRQKNATGVQIIHKESGAIGRCSESRSQAQNKKQAFLNLVETPKMKIWLNKKMYEIRNDETLEQFVDNWMDEKNLKIEVKNEEGKWTAL